MTARAQALGKLVDGVEAMASTNDHVMDAVLAAYVAWLGPERLDQPPEGFNLASGWIWLPRAA